MAVVAEKRTGRIRVLILIDTLNPGGAQVQVRNFLANCPPSVEPIVCVLSRKGYCSAEIEKLCFPVYLNRGKYDVRAFNDVKNVVERVQPDVIHAHLHKSMVMATIVGRLTQKPTLLHFHSSLALAALGSVVPFGLHWFYRWLLIAAARRATRCIVVTRCAADQLVQFGVRQTRVAVIPNGIVLGPFNETYANRGRIRRSVRMQEGVPDDSMVVGMIGRPSPVKGWPTFLAAAEKLGDRNLVFWAIGGGDFSSWRSKAEATGVASKFFWLGQRDDVHRLITAIDVLVLSSIAESFGLVILEGWAAGVPVVATSTDGPSELISHNVNGLLVPVNCPDELADAVCALIRNPDLCARLARAGRERVKRYDARQVAGRIVREYESLIAALAEEERNEL